DWSQYYEWYSRLDPNEILTKGKELFEDAARLTTDSVQRSHIKKSAIQIRFMESYYRHARLELIRENISTLVPLLVDEYMEIENDSSVLKTTMINYIMSPLEEQYEVFNKALFNEMFEFDINYVGEARRLSIINKKHYNYSNTPDSWGPNTWGT
ncbi:MAG: hypothetical protein IKC55_02315, partial [Clostridia bacterium]|nr:hypothetical protein [Clostridia bacterium]